VYTFARFPFPIALTFIHTVFTALGLKAFRAFGVFKPKALTWRQTTPLAAAFCGYIASQNLSLKFNSVGFFQICKIAITPAVLLLQYALFSTVQSGKVKASIVVVCAGVTLATVTDLSATLLGATIAGASIFVTALFQIWMGSKQKEFDVNSNQLLDQYSPYASVIMLCLIPFFEPVGQLGDAPVLGVLDADAEGHFYTFEVLPSGEGEVTVDADAEGHARSTLLGWFQDPSLFTTASAVLILVSSVLGLVVNLSAMLVIAHTSTLTYNVVGHVKTVLVLVGGVVIFGDTMPLKKFVGVSVTMAGVIWYSVLKMRPAAKPTKLVDIGEKLNGGAELNNVGGSSRVDLEGAPVEARESMQALLSGKS
jgi:solute carrier family 35 protein E3